MLQLNLKLQTKVKEEYQSEEFNLSASNTKYLFYEIKIIALEK